MFCTRCGTQNPEDVTSCRSCSAPLVKPGDTPRQPGGFNPSPYASPSGSQSSQPSQPQPPGQAPYPGYQGYPVYQSGYANQPAPQQGSASGRAIASLVLSILGLIACGFLTSIPGLILGKMEMNAINAGEAPRAGETLAKVGFYLGIAGTAIYCLVGVIWAVIAMIGATSGIH
jgi:hypothetical protein